MNKHHHVEVEKPHTFITKPQDAVTPHEQAHEAAAVEAMVEAHPEINGFNFTLNIPVVVPSPETVEATPIGEAYVNKLIADGYLNREEAVAYLTFAAMTAPIPMMMDAFLGVYRTHKK